MSSKRFDHHKKLSLKGTHSHHHQRPKKHEFLLDEFLDHHVSMRVILKILVYLLIILVVIGGSFWLGRISIAHNQESPTVVDESETKNNIDTTTIEKTSALNSNETSKNTTTTETNTDLNKTVEVTISTADNNQNTENKSQLLINETISINQTQTNLTSLTSSNETDNNIDSNATITIDTAKYDENGKFLAHDYENVLVNIGEVSFKKRGDTWGSFEEAEITFTNGESFAIYPQTVKVKVYDSGDSPPKWFDDETDISEMNIQISSGTVKSVTVPIHASTSGLEESKKVSIYFVDLYDETIGYATKTMDVE
ncbi:hypothetical protein HOK51_11175 [Candidatus Woesearchaeota archaeon]|jgi:hypothetical protein|nr:hypothetical protein [Candidatus Woesearchaeota archaeon]MBT6520384.1 hypothetical protein [Candidatus Woesearchaeota archaeon]MBT7368715.1 hypothetical protein [Candidatus Woesearchaeota archaeon]